MNDDERQLLMAAASYFGVGFCRDWLVLRRSPRSLVMRAGGDPAVVIRFAQGQSHISADVTAALSNRLRSNTIFTVQRFVRGNCGHELFFPSRQTTASCYHFIDGKVMQPLPMAYMHAMPRFIRGASTVLSQVHCADIELPLADEMFATDFPLGVELLARLGDPLSIVPTVSTLAPPFEAFKGGRLIHGDINAGNLVWQPGGAISLIDFESASVGSTLAELVPAFTSLSFAGTSIDFDRLSLLVDEFATDISSLVSPAEFVDLLIASTVAFFFRSNNSSCARIDIEWRDAARVRSWLDAREKVLETLV